ncbi:mitochondrial phosphate carrier protein 2 [Aspergillus lentulus]|uniref:Mitochondrial phosphate carrier protein 2 n=1 Tax=Aspergillus lentulus TaxID=293939 RepID=A0AAN5YPI1_ASPLE|nr:mitochondrial phosphate carrier protein 2 [Aspergillus lentulus]KAF4158295.1 hypothetical protein CNMCM6069_004228 [Aspergillus lentulus]KAF4160991.1 hypothetical protein CNMCM6936_003728 [Aspergillus lentulus]KAF4176019.1 hypothetical protein CNMCM8060_006723 [Aspergillus lentulus]KAF4186049.1 hypothetical protein CNMCM7927_005961 [Aspergillus lentulus]KAF4196333.1 hypothetical protein CNMCM8694_005245 [Aspergillus lentulus]
MFPSDSVILDAFNAQNPLNRPQEPKQAGSAASIRREPFPAWSVIDESKKKADAFTKEAAREFDVVSQKAQAKTGKIEPWTPKYYAACTVGGLLACGLTHTAVTPLDLVKCRRQVDSQLYKSNMEAFRVIRSAEGMRGVFTGWSPTFFGYSAQGAFKYGGYEFFKKFYSDLVGPERAHKWKTSVYLAASASAEFIADVALCPFEAVKVRTQTTIPPEFKGTFSGISQVVGKEGVAGLYKGLYPLWGRQIPYTMMKFASFETIVEAIYKRLPRKKEEYGKGAQTAVAFTGGYLAGILCAVVSHPADVMVSKLNATRLPGEAFGAAMGRIYKDIGFTGLWNGLPVRIVMIGTLTGLQWMIYDSFKIFMGLPTTGGGPPAEKKETKTAGF